MFLADTTLKALRTSVLSTLTEELFKEHSYKYVLSGKWNQDCIEVYIKKKSIVFSHIFKTDVLNSKHLLFSPLF